MHLFPAPLLLASVALAAAQTAPTAPPASSPEPMATYRNDALHLSYSYPSSYVDASAMVGPAFEASLSGDPAAAAQAKCISMPLSRMASGKNQLGILLLIRADSTCLHKKFNARSVTELAQGESQGLAASGARTAFGAPFNYSLANRPASIVQGNFTLPTGQTLQAMVACVLDQPDIVCWQFLADTPEHLKVLSAFPVTFDGSPATHLEPAQSPTKP